MWWLLSFLWKNLVPSPLEALAYLASQPPYSLLDSLAASLWHSLLGYAIALSLSYAGLMLYYLGGVFAEAVRSLNTLVQSVSVLAWILVFIVVFGTLSPLTPVLVSAAASFPILLSGMIGAVEALDKKFFEITRTLGATRLQEFLYIIVPGSVPYLAAASRSALGVALRITVVAEAFGGRSGIGYQLYLSYDLGDIVGVYAWAVYLVVVMVVLDVLLLSRLEKWARKWMV